MCFPRTYDCIAVCELGANVFVYVSNLPSENRAAGIGGKSTRLREGASNSNGGGRGGSGGATGSTGARGADGPNAQSFLYPYGQVNISLVTS